VLALLREDELTVGEDVELRLRAFANRGAEASLSELGRETRGPSVVPASDRAVEDLDAHSGERTLGFVGRYAALGQRFPLCGA
jgi:hypothetical protein